MYVLYQDSVNILAAKYEKKLGETGLLAWFSQGWVLTFLSKKKKIDLFFSMTQIDWIKWIFPKLMIGNQNNDTPAG